MDVLAHALWTNAVFYKKFTAQRMQRFMAVLFGLLPDIVSFAPAVVFLLITRQNFSPGLYNSSNWVFRFAEISYQYSHSMVIFLGTMLLVALVRRGKIYWPMWGWGLHIFIDVFTHKGFYETPFLFPLSDYRFTHGIPWAHPGFMVVNYSVLAVVYLVWFLVVRKRSSV